MNLLNALHKITTSDFIKRVFKSHHFSTLCFTHHWDCFLAKVSKENNHCCGILKRIFCTFPSLSILTPETPKNRCELRNYTIENCIESLFKNVKSLHVKLAKINKGFPDKMGVIFVSLKRAKTSSSSGTARKLTFAF